MANLVALATELIIEILLYVRQKDLSNISLTCKSLRECTLPFLYRTVDWTWVASKNEASNPAALLLLRSILENHILAYYIENVEFQAIGYRALQQYPRPPDQPTRSQTLDYADLTRANELIQAAELPQPGDWQMAIADGDLGATIALILIQLPNLKRLAIGPDLQKDNPFLSITFRHFLDAPDSAKVSRFTRLEHVNLSADIDGNDCRHHCIPLHLAQFLPFFYLPSLTTAEMLLPDLRDWPNRQSISWRKPQLFSWPIDRAPRATALTSLRLRRSRASVMMLDPILAATPQLKELEYDYFCDCQSSLDGEELKNALRHVSSTLLSLKIALTPYEDEADEVMEDGESCLSGSLGSLKGFKSLETLEISRTVLLGWYGSSHLALSDVLPASLRAVSFRDDCWAFAEWEWREEQSLATFHEFLGAGNWRHTTPKLKSFNLRLLEPRLERDWDPRREAIRQVCEAQGLECNIVKVRKDLPWWYGRQY